MSEYQHIQVLLEIALAIGEGHHLHSVAKKALSAYLRKLNCSSGAIYQYSELQKETTDQVSSIPNKIENHAAFLYLKREVPGFFSNAQTVKYPSVVHIEQDMHAYLMELQGFGRMVLIKNGTTFSNKFISLLEPVNKKLAHACLAEQTKEKDLLQSAALNHIANAIVITNPFGEIVWVNEAWCNHTGYTKNDAIGQKTSMLNSGYHTKEFFDKLWKTILAGKVWQGEIFNKRADNEVFVEDTTITPLIDNSGLITHFIGVSKDITERRDMEEKLRESEEKFRSIIENANDGIYLRDLEGTITFANEKFARIHEYPLNEIIGRKSWAFLHPDDLKKIQQEGELERVQQGDFTEGEERGLTKSGKVIYLDIRTAPLVVDKKIIGIFGIIRDITKRKAFEEQIRESEERFKSTANLLPQPIWETNINGYYTYTNKAGFEQFGYTEKELRNNVYFTDLIAPQQREKAMKEFGRAFINQEPMVREFMCVRRDGSTFPALIYSDIILKEGNLVGMRGITVDITDLKNIQEKLLQSQQDLMVQNARYEKLNDELVHTNKELTKAKETAEFAEQAQSNFLSTMSHEIRTPMNAVVGLTNILLTENPVAHQIKNLKTLKFSSQNLLSIINNILDFNKLESGNVIIEKIDFNIQDLIDGVYFSMQPLAKHKDIELQFSIDKQVPLQLVGDSTRLVQIINNLVSNCLKFTSKGHVKVGVSSVRKHQNEVWLRFDVEDTGIGIADEHIEKIFDAFKQAEESTSRMYGGTGLGLPIVKKLLELQDSSIQVKSELGVGTHFTFTLKYQIGEENTVSDDLIKLEEENNSLNNIQVLVVEDNKVNQIVVSQFLNRWGCNYDIADNGLNALEKIKERAYQLILMDLQMPELDGYETTKIIRKNERETKQHIPIIALSASALMEIRAKTRKIGMDGFVTKPFMPDQLFNTMKHFVNKYPIA